MILVFLLARAGSRACVMEFEQNKNTQPEHNKIKLIRYRLDCYGYYI